MQQNSKVITKRYALSQFRTPYVPDQDRQELPNSTLNCRYSLTMTRSNNDVGVLLDFIDGSTLQCACEHPQGQADVLLGKSTCILTSQDFSLQYLQLSLKHTHSGKADNISFLVSIYPIVDISFRSMNVNYSSNMAFRLSSKSTL
jgi:hypothetical protein